jgi:hypothetical protein
MLINFEPEIKQEIVHTLSTQKHYKVAAALVKDFKLKLDEFPVLAEIIESSSANHFISRSFMKKDHQEYMSIYKVEDLF